MNNDNSNVPLFAQVFCLLNVRTVRLLCGYMQCFVHVHIRACIYVCTYVIHVYILNVLMFACRIFVSICAIWGLQFAQACVTCICLLHAQTHLCEHEQMGHIYVSMNKWDTFM